MPVLLHASRSWPVLNSPSICFRRMLAPPLVVRAAPTRRQALHTPSAVAAAPSPAITVVAPVPVPRCPLLGEENDDAWLNSSRLPCSSFCRHPDLDLDLDPNGVMETLPTGREDSEVYASSRDRDGDRDGTCMAIPGLPSTLPERIADSAPYLSTSTFFPRITALISV